jgi:hypothetical protein
MAGHTEVREPPDQKLRTFEATLIELMQGFARLTRQRRREEANSPIVGGDVTTQVFGSFGDLLERVTNPRMLLCPTEIVTSATMPIRTHRSIFALDSITTPRCIRAIPRSIPRDGHHRPCSLGADRRNSSFS